MKIAVFGDVGVDRYIICKARGLSAEAPIPVLDQVDELFLPGMAGNVAKNFTHLEVDGELFPPPSGLPVKNRLITEEGLQVARFDEEDWCSPYTAQDIPDAGLDNFDAVVVSDYGKGSITDEFARALKYIPTQLFVDTKRDPACWLPGENIIFFPNLAEYRQFKESYEWFPQVILKQGAQGISYLQYGKVVLTRPALATQVACVNGAGDTTLAAYVVATLLGATIPQALDIASAAAAEVVESPFSKRWVSVDDVVDRVLLERELEEEKELCASH